MRDLLPAEPTHAVEVKAVQVHPLMWPRSFGPRVASLLVEPVSLSLATEIRVIPAESSGSPDQVFDGLGSAGYGGRKNAGWSWTSTPPTDRLSETDTLI